MRTKKEYDNVMSLWEQGLNKHQISRKTNIPRRTILDWIQGNVKYFSGPVSQLAEEHDLKSCKCRFDSYLGYHYSYLLGLYLGDGYICKSKRVYKLRIALTTKYSDIINECIRSTSYIFQQNKVNSLPKTQPNCTDVYVYKKDLPDYFPQHGPGKKHTRKIELESWQKEITKHHPTQFIKGLIHSDGCRYIAKPKYKDKVYKYIHYNFTNFSKDIIDIFTDVCDSLGIKYTVAKTNKRVYITDKRSVKFLDSFIGPKQ